MFFLFRSFGSGNTRSARIGAVVLIAALIVARVVLVTRHGASSDIALAVIIGLLAVRIALMGRRRVSRGGGGQIPPSTNSKSGPFG